MSKRLANKKQRIKKLPNNNADDRIDPQSAEQISLRTQNIVEFSKFSYELEEKREQSLIEQSSQMLTAFSIASAALLMAVPIILEYTCISKCRILISAGLVLFFMLISMVLAVISQWRFKYKTMMNGDELLQKVEKNAKGHIYQAQYDYQWIDQLKEIQDSKKKNNDKRYKLIHASMIFFLIATASLLLCSLMIILLKK